MLEKTHETSCDLESGGMYWAQDAEKDFIQANAEKFTEAQRDEELPMNQADVVMLYNHQNNFWACWPTSAQLNRG